MPSGFKVDADTRRNGDVRSIIRSRCPMVASWSPSKAPGTYITKPPKAEHEAAEWQAAMEALILVATRGGPTMLARIGVPKALNTGKPEPEITPRRERAKRYRIVR
jgi:hypothetical protein